MFSCACRSLKKSPALSARAAIAYHHGLERPGEDDPTESIAVRKVISAITKKWSKPCKKAVPLSSREVAKLVLKLKDGSYKDLCTAVMVVL